MAGISFELEWAYKWNQTLIELTELNRQLGPIQDIKDPIEREKAMKPLRQKFIDLHYKRIDLLLERK